MSRGRLEYDIEGTQFVVHLKDAEKVQRGKRWSQVMYLYYLIGWKIDATDEMEISGANEKLEKDKCFILALDGDVDFDPPALEIVLNRLKRNDHVAACCSQIHPMGSSWLVMYQRFEYAVGHWLQKTTEHVLGCVLCSPGCFSLVRVSHLARPNVMAMYKSLARTPLEKLQFDQGEDRWLCTLMLTSGGRIEFEASAHCNTFAPEDLPTFYKQRRRWGPSTTANVWQLILNQFDARKNNPYISLPYVLYHLFMLMFSIIGVSTTMMMVAEAFYIALGYNLDKGFCYLIVMAPVVIFCIACYLSGNGDLQIKLASWLSLMFSFLMLIVLIGIIMEGVNCPFSPSFLFFVGLAGVHIVAGLLHFDVKSLFCGVVYFLFIPSCFIFLQIYSIANLNDFSWGTRQAASKTAANDNRSFFQKIMGAEIKEEDPVDPVQNDGYGCHCNLCPTIVPAKNTKLYANNDDDKPKVVTSEFQSQVCDNDFIPDAPDRISIEEIPPDTQELAYMMEDEFDEEYLQENIMKESYYGGETVHELKNSEFTEWTKKMTNCEYEAIHRLKMNPEQPSDPRMSFSYGWLYNREIEAFKREGKFVNESERMKLEKAKRTKTEKDYLGWVISNKSPIDDHCTVHVLSNPEYIFWRDMVDPTDGYIGLKSNGEKYEELVENEKQLVKDVNEFRAEKYGLYLFINTVWVVISTIVLKYSAELLQIPIKVPNIAKCDSGEGSDEGTFGIFLDANLSRDGGDGEDGDNDSDWAEIKLQPLSLFFLAFYVILIIAQFICMLWHRVSTFYHFVADVDISMQRREIERKKRAALEASLTAEGEKIEDIDKTQSERKLEEINRAFLDDEGPGPDSDPGAGGSMHAKHRRKSTIRFENVSSDDDDDDEGDQVEIIQPTEEDIRKMIERRQERRKSSIFHGEGSILFAASKEQSRFQQSRLNSPMLQKIRQKSSANIYGKSPLSVQTSYGDDDVFSEAGDFINKEHSHIEPAARPPSENSSTVSNGQEKKFLKNYMRISYTTANKIDLTDITESDADDSSYGSQHSGEASNGSETNTPRGVGFTFPQTTVAEPQQIQQMQPPLLYAKNPRIQQLRSRSPFPSVDC